MSYFCQIDKSDLGCGGLWWHIQMFLVRAEYVATPTVYPKSKLKESLIQPPRRNKLFTAAIFTKCRLAGLRPSDPVLLGLHDLRDCLPHSGLCGVLPGLAPPVSPGSSHCALWCLQSLLTFHPCLMRLLAFLQILLREYSLMVMCLLHEVVNLAAVLFGCSPHLQFRGENLLGLWIVNTTRDNLQTVAAKTSR